MTKALEKAFETARSLPEKEQEAVADIVLSMVERAKGVEKIDLAEIARRARAEAKRQGMTEETFDDLMADA